MCIELPGRVVELPPDRVDVARVDVAGVIKSIHLGLLHGERPAPGDWVAIHLGFAIARITEVEAAEAIAFAEGDQDDGWIERLLASAAVSSEASP